MRDQVGVSPSVSAHASSKRVVPARPPNTIARSRATSRTRLCSVRPAGSGPAGSSCVQVGVAPQRERPGLVDPVGVVLDLAAEHDHAFTSRLHDRGVAEPSVRLPSPAGSSRVHAAAPSESAPHVAMVLVVVAAELDHTVARGVEDQSMSVTSGGRGDDGPGTVGISSEAGRERNERSRDDQRDPEDEREARPRGSRVHDVCRKRRRASDLPRCRVCRDAAKARVRASARRPCAVRSDALQWYRSAERESSSNRALLRAILPSLGEIAAPRREHCAEDVGND